MAVAVARTELDAAGLRRAAARTKDADAARRMLALASVLSPVLDGRARTGAAGPCGMDRRTLRDRVRRCDRPGLPALSGRVPPGAERRLSSERGAEPVRNGPSVAAWCVGAGSTGRGRSGRASAGSWPSAASARCRVGRGSAACPPGRAIPATTRPRRGAWKDFAGLVAAASRRARMS